jgi:hypothetical protein
MGVWDMTVGGSVGGLIAAINTHSFALPHLAMAVREDQQQDLG